MTTLSAPRSDASHLFSAPVIVAALGYFVDIYDLLLFGIVRLPSLASLGLNDTEISLTGASILNWQMTGLLLGGILWGVLGDKKGRLSVLFGSILTYSLANIACGFVQDADTYKVLRFIAGVGLAGELGAGITLVSEILPKHLRAIGTSLVAGIGLLGAVVAYFTVEYFSWRYAYFIGGGLGISLLLLRLGVFESGIFKDLKNQEHVQKGNFFSLFTNKNRLSRYLKCIGIGLPTWFVIGILSTFSNEFGSALGITEPVKPGLSIMWCYVGLSIGDLCSGFLSHWLKSRKKAVLYLMIFTLLFSGVFLYAGINNVSQLYTVAGLLGFGIGYWAMFVTIGAEQFGTNLRATAATTIPNMVRGTVVLMTTLFAAFKDSFSVINSGALVGLICFAIGLFCIITIPETHGRDLDFLEE
ncbi:MFS transporter [Dyadobacter sediminis]|uniref:MFS transporter n=1 Tax=Dyadobacter sediminis TaxID=1493691 RepID=A0A5R9K9I6_9BACT|nr:MFS transporter [Dyadobacter sediminis]TLU90711.1 MFS transporter [Dyadobacter sediminis]GGC10196.1 MFS transporter [Dyadobacter sediminis]